MSEHYLRSVYSQRETGTLFQARFLDNLPIQDTPLNKTRYVRVALTHRIAAVPEKSFDDRDADENMVPGKF